jgi:hypothetical protein
MKKLKNLFTLTIAWRIARSPRSGIFVSNMIFVTGYQNKKENEILSFRTLYELGSVMLMLKKKKKAWCVMRRRNVT